MAAVYFIQAVTLGCIKIGKADCARTRFRTLRTASPDALMILGVIETDEPSALERDLHARFGAHRLHGEWFRPAPELLGFIAEHAGSAPPQRNWRAGRPNRARPKPPAPSVRQRRRA